MTYCGAFLIKSFPTLISDLMISQEGRVSRNRNHSLSIRETVNMSDINRSVVMAKRKVAILAPGLAVAFAGSLVGGAGVIRKLRAYCETGVPSGSELETFLATIEEYVVEKFQCTVIGWLGGATGFSAFRWESAQPEEIFWGTEFHIGSGAEAFGKVVKMPPTEDSHDTPRPDTLAVEVVMRCVQHEIDLGGFSAASTGLWFEGICWHPESKRFEYISPIDFRWIRLSEDVGPTEPPRPATLRMSVSYEAREHASVYRLRDRRTEERAKALSLEIAMDVDAYDTSTLGDLRQYLYNIPSIRQYYAWRIEFPFAEGGSWNVHLVSAGPHELVYEVDGRLHIKSKQIYERYWRGLPE